MSGILFELSQAAARAAVANNWTVDEAVSFVTGADDRFSEFARDSESQILICRLTEAVVGEISGFAGGPRSVVS